MKTDPSAPGGLGAPARSQEGLTSMPRGLRSMVLTPFGGLPEQPLEATVKSSAGRQAAQGWQARVQPAHRRTPAFIDLKVPSWLSHPAQSG